MAILHAGVPSEGAPSGVAPAPPRTPGLFVATVLPATAVSAAQPAELLPAHALARQLRGRGGAAPDAPGDAQLVVSTQGALELLAVDALTGRLVRVERVAVFGRVQAVGRMRTECGAGIDVLLVLVERSKLSFVMWDEGGGGGLVCVGSVMLFGVGSGGGVGGNVRGDARLLCVHPRRKIAAVATLESRVAVFPVIFLPDCVSAGRVASVAVDGVVLSMTFLEDDEGDESGARSVLIALVQQKTQQFIAVFAVGAHQDAGGGGGLSIAMVASMATCAATSEDLAVARAQSKLTGLKARPPRAASTVVAVHGMPYHFVVFLDGRLVVADARSTVCHTVVAAASWGGRSVLRAHGRAGSLRRSTGQRSRTEGEGQVLGVANHAAQPAGDADAVMENGVDDCGAIAFAGPAAEGSREEARMETEEWTGSGPDGSISLNASAPSDMASASQFESLAAGSASALSSCPDGTVSGDDDDDGDDDGQEEQFDAQESEQMEAQAQEDVSQRGGDGDHVDDDETSVQDAPVDEMDDAETSQQHEERGDDISRRSADARRAASSSRGMPGRSASLSGFHMYASCLYMPPHIALDVGDSCEGHVVAVTSGDGHFRVEGGDDHDSGLYAVMESGRMYALRWQTSLRSDRVPCFVIPRTSARHDAASATLSSPFYSLEAVGDVGPASAVAALTGNLLYVSNDGADGSLRSVYLPSRPLAPYRLPVRQEFLNTAPISDFAIVSPHRRLQAEVKPGRLTSPAMDDGTNSRSQSSSRRLLRKRKARGTKAPADEAQIDHAHSAAAAEAGESEGHVIVCCGFGQLGTLRILRPGAAVSLFSSSEQSFPGCNGIWSVRATRRSPHHSFLVLTFAESTGVYFIAPPRSPSPRVEPSASAPPIAQLLDGSEASRLFLDCRTITAGLLEDGVLAQVHRGGVRLVELKKLSEAGPLRSPVHAAVDGSVDGSIAECLYDWTPPAGSFLSVACLDRGHIVVAVRNPSSAVARLIHLCRRHLAPGSLSVDIVSEVSVDAEVSSLTIPTWGAGGDARDDNEASQDLDVVIVTTHAPAVQIRSLSSGLCVVASYGVGPSASRLLAQTRLRDPTMDSSRFSPLPIASVAESVCALELGHRKMVIVGRRDGCVMVFEIFANGFRDKFDEPSNQCQTPVSLQLLSQRRLGVKPVRLSLATIALGTAVLAECERPWIGTVSRHSLDWTPLNFPETRACAALSFPGAERCIAFVSADDALHIGAVKRSMPLTVSTIRVGATPRRVVSLGAAGKLVVVATSCDEASPSVEHESLSPARFLRRSLAGLASTDRDARSYDALIDSKPCKPGRFLADPAVSELRVFDQMLGTIVCQKSLLPNELVHVLLFWQDFIVVGTSVNLRRSHAHGEHVCDRGRLLLFSLSGASSARKLEQRCEAVLPGAVLAGAVNVGEDCIVVSSNENIYVFALTLNRGGLVEVARTSTRMLVVSLTMRQGLVCAADRKDSVVFYRINVAAQQLMRCRGDYRKRIVSDAVLVDDCTAIATDRFGHLFSLAYDKRDQVRLPESGVDLTLVAERSLYGPDSSPDASADAIPRESPDASGDDSDAMDAAVAEEEDDEEGPNLDPDLGVPEGQGSDVEEQAHEDQNGSTEDEADGDDQDGSLVVPGDPMESFVVFRGPQPIQRHLVSDHSYGLEDVGVRTRSGTFMRREQRDVLETKRGEPNGVQSSFWYSSESCVLTCTLGGAIVAAIPVGIQETFILRKLSRALASHPSVLGASIGVSHESHRSAFGEKMQGTVDGDLLLQFCELNIADQGAIASAAGFADATAAQEIVELIHSLWDHVM